MTGIGESSTKKDFFVSRSGEDARWAEWIAWQLESAGYSVVVQDWDFQAGSNFVSNMRRALDSAETTIAVYSPAYFRSRYTEDEWTAAFARPDSDGRGHLLPIRVAEVDVPEILRPIVYVDIVGLDEASARARVLDAVRGSERMKPSTEPRFPGVESPRFPAGPGPRPRAGTVHVVNNPPVEAARFTDRVDAIRGLRDHLRQPAVRMVRIVGRVGVGKSALATHVLDLEECDAEGDGTDLFEGIVMLSARTTGLSFERVFADVRRLLDDEAAAQLSADWSRLDLTVGQKVDVVLDSLRGRRLVILLDGLEASLGDDGVIVEEGLRSFVDACIRRADGPRLLVTSRTDVAVSPDAFPVVRSLPMRIGLPTADAVALLRLLDPQQELGLANAADDELVRAAELVEGIPRALEILAGILEADRAASLARLLTDETRLGSRVVDVLVAEVYRRLTPDEQRVLETMAAFDALVPAAAIEFVIHTWFPQIDVGAALRRLVASFFTTVSRDTGEYLLQSADRLYAYEQIAESTAGPYHRAALESRVADYYVSLRRPPDEWRSIESLAPQLGEYLHRIRAREGDRALELLQTIDSEHLFLWGHYTRLVELRQMALDLPTSLPLRAANLAGLGVATQVLGQYDTAVGYYEAAVDASKQAGDAEAYARHVGDLGRLYRNLGYMDKALTSSHEALEFATASGDRAAVGRLKDRLGLVVIALGQLDEARELHEESIAAAREFGDRRSEGAALSNLGVVLQHLGRMAEANDVQAAALTVSREVRDRRGEVIVLGRLGALAERRGAFEPALALHEEALGIARQLGERREQSYQLLGLGKARFGLGLLADAERDLRSTFQFEVPETSFLAALNLALVLTAAGRHDESAAAFVDAARCCEERLARSASLFAARYALATARVGSLISADAWNHEADRPSLLAPALLEYERALANCSGRGVIESTLRDLQVLTAVLGDDGEPVVALLRAALPPEAGVVGEQIPAT